jgi:hypothetical protein
VTIEFLVDDVDKELGRLETHVGELLIVSSVTEIRAIWRIPGYYLDLGSSSGLPSGRNETTWDDWILPCWVEDGLDRRGRWQ